MIYEYLVIAGYFLLVIGIGFTFKKMASKSRELLDSSPHLAIEAWVAIYITTAARVPAVSPSIKALNLIAALSSFRLTLWVL